MALIDQIREMVPEPNRLRAFIFDPILEKTIRLVSAEIIPDIVKQINENLYNLIHIDDDYVEILKFLTEKGIGFFRRAKLYEFFIKISGTVIC